MDGKHPIIAKIIVEGKRLPFKVPTSPVCSLSTGHRPPGQPGKRSRCTPPIIYAKFIKMPVYKAKALQNDSTQLIERILFCYFDHFVHFPSLACQVHLQCVSFHGFSFRWSYCAIFRPLSSRLIRIPDRVSLPEVSKGLRIRFLDRKTDGGRRKGKIAFLSQCASYFPAGILLLLKAPGYLRPQPDA